MILVNQSLGSVSTNTIPRGAKSSPSGQEMSQASGPRGMNFPILPSSRQFMDVCIKLSSTQCAHSLHGNKARGKRRVPVIHYKGTRYRGEQEIGCSSISVLLLDCKFISMFNQGTHSSVILIKLIR